MTRAQEIAKALHQVVTLLVMVGVLATIGFAMMFLEAVGSEGGGYDAVLVVAYALSMWIGLAWMIQLAQGVAELLAPSKPS